MRILIITDQFPPKHFGGMAQHAWHISHYLAKKHEVQILVPEDHSIDEGGLPFSIAPRLTMRLPRIDAMRALSVAKKFKPDVIHVCTAGLAFPSLAKRYPIVTRVVGNDFMRPWCGGSFLLRSLYYRVPNKKFREHVKNRESSFRQRSVIEQLNRCVGVVANTWWTRERLEDAGVLSSLIRVVTGGCDTVRFVPSVNKQKLRQQLGFSPDEVVLLVASNLVSDKAIDVMLHAISRIVRNYSEIRYVVVGSGKEEQSLKKLCSDLGQESIVDFVGHKLQQELKDYYQSADIYVQASRVESMGRTYMEAGACGVPVIVSRVGGVPSVVEHGKNGLLVDDPENVDEVVEKITSLLENPDLRLKMGAEGIRLAKEKFSWELVGATFENILSVAAK